MSGPQVHRLADGRLHLNHGPIDLICEGWRERSAVEAAYSRAARRFAEVLDDLVAELPAFQDENQPLNGQVAQKMARAVAPFRPAVITPMKWPLPWSADVPPPKALRRGD